MKITVLGTSLDNYNLGVGALASGVIACIAEHFPDAEISILTFAPESSVRDVKCKERTISVRTVNLRMKPSSGRNALFLLAIAAALRVVPARRLREYLIAKSAVLNDLHESDMIVSIAGGDSFSDIYGLRRLVDVSLPQFMAILLRRPLVLLPQTIGPFQSSLARGLAQIILKQAARIYCRDRESVKVAERMLGGVKPPKKVQFCYDVAFVMEPVAPARLDVAGLSLDERADSELVGLNVSGLLYRGGYKQNDVFGFRNRYVDETHRIVEELVVRKNVRVLLVPHTLGTGTESDSNVCEALYQEFKDRYPGRIGVIRGSYAPWEMKYIIGRCGFFIGGRMHACIAALSQGVPAIAFAYSRKFSGVLATLGVEGLVVDPKTMPSSDVIERISRRFDERMEFGRRLLDRLPAVKKCVLSLFSDISLSGAATVATARHSPRPVDTVPATVGEGD